MYDVIIIGSGLGGGLCGCILSKEGYKVCLLEKNKKTGGCLQVFTRDKCIFNTGLHYLQELNEGEVLYRYFKYTGILDKLLLKRLDIDGFERITFGGKEYRYCQGSENFINGLSKDFPGEEANLKAYIQKMNQICNEFPFYNFDRNNHSLNPGILSKSAFDFIKTITSNTTLQNILAGTNLIYGGVAEKTPLYLHSLIVSTFIKSAWRLTNGSARIPAAYEEVIIKNGGIVKRESEVKSLIFENGNVKSAELTNGEQIEGKIFISNVHPAATLKMIGDKFITKAYRYRINNLENTLGMFSLYISLKDDAYKYMNYNHYYYDSKNVWTATHYSESGWPESYILYTPYNTGKNDYADCMIAMTYMKYSELMKWENTTTGNRGEEYEELKRKKAEKLLDLIEKKFPDIRSKIKNYYTSTPLTYRDYTATKEGSSYGILKDYNNTVKALVSPRTKIPNLYFTGQNLNVHGILGVTIGAFMTCGEILGYEYLINKVKRMD